MAQPLVTQTDRGLYCPPGDFYIDPWRPVPRAVITHAHADHARRGCGRYLVRRARPQRPPDRLGPDAAIDGLAYGRPVVHNGVRVSLHPAGHVLGSAQVRLEHRGEVWVVYRRLQARPGPDLRPVRAGAAATPSSPNRRSACRSTAGPPPDEVFADVNAWWRANRDAGKASLLYGYALGKAAARARRPGPDDRPDLHARGGRAADAAYRDSGVSLPPTTPTSASAAQRRRLGRGR